MFLYFVHNRKLFLIYLCITYCFNPRLSLLRCSLQDPVATGETEIKRSFEELYENMQQAFRNLED